MNRHSHHSVSRLIQALDHSSLVGAKEAVTALRSNAVYACTCRIVVRGNSYGWRTKRALLSRFGDIHDYVSSCALGPRLAAPLCIVSVVRQVDDHRHSNHSTADFCALWIVPPEQLGRFQGTIYAANFQARLASKWPGIAFRLWLGDDQGQRVQTVETLLLHLARHNHVSRQADAVIVLGGETALRRHLPIRRAPRPRFHPA